MKTVTFMIFSVLVLAMMVHAGMDVENDDLDFGSDTQEKSTTDTPITETESLTVDVTEFTFTDLAYEFEPESDFSADILEEVDFSVSEFAIDGSYPVEVVLQVPSNFNSVNEDLEETDFRVGDLRIVGTDSDGNVKKSNPVTLHLQVQNLVEIVKVQMDKDGAITSLSDGSTYTVDAGDELDIEVTVKNDAAGDSDILLEEVEIIVKIDDLNIEEDKSIRDIEEDQEESNTVGVEIDNDDSGVFDVEVWVRGEDEYNGIHGEIFEFKIDIKESSEETDVTVDDQDGDGVTDDADLCPNTFSQCDVDSDGCEIDSDFDGTCDALDPTPIEESENEPIVEEQEEVNVELEEFLARKKQEEEEKKREKEQAEQEEEKNGEEDGSAVVPFIFGFLFGLVVSVFFFLLVKS